MQQSLGNADIIVAMPRTITFLRSLSHRRHSQPTVLFHEACSWDRMRAVYEEQAERGVPEAVRGLELIEHDRWPSSGRPRTR